MIAAVKPDRPPWIVPTLAMVAAFFGVSHAVVRSDWRPYWPPECGKPGAWNLQSILSWRDARRRNPSTAVAASHDMTDLAHRRRIAELAHEEARAALAGRKNERDAGALIPRHVAERDLLQLIHLYRTRLELLPEQLEMSFPAETRTENKLAVAEYARSTLRELARMEFLTDPTAATTLLRMADEYRAAKNGEAAND